MRYLGFLILATLTACAQTKQEARTQPEPVAEPPPEEATPDEKLLDQTEQEVEYWRQYGEVEYRRRLALARRYRDRLEPQKALPEVEAALRYKPTSEEARALRNDLLRMLGVRAGESTTFLDDAWERQRVKRAQHKVTIKRELAEAARAAEAGDYEQARRAYERVLFIVNTAKKEPPGPDRELIELGKEAGEALGRLRKE